MTFAERCSVNRGRGTGGRYTKMVLRETILNHVIFIGHYRGQPIIIVAVQLITAKPCAFILVFNVCLLLYYIGAIALTVGSVLCGGTILKYVVFIGHYRGQMIQQRMKMTYYGIVPCRTAPSSLNASNVFPSMYLLSSALSKWPLCFLHNARNVFNE